MGLLIGLSLAAVALFTPVGGVVVQTVASTVSYAGMAVASIWDEEIREDMNAIGWNPFNSDEMATLNSQKVSFYKGVPVFRTEARRSGTFLGIFLSKRERTANIVKHEWGHTFQQLLLGPAGYGINIGIPSINQMGSWSKNGSYYDAPWETMADMFGGANWGTPHTNNERVLAVAHLLVAFFYGPISFLFTLF